MRHVIDFEPVGRRGECPAGATLLECARALGVQLVNICGGGGSCGTCLVQVVAGKTSAITSSERDAVSPEKLSAGYRLACCVVPHSDCKIRVPIESLGTQQRIQIEGQELDLQPDPAARSYLLELDPPSLADTKADAERLSCYLAGEYGLVDLRIDFDVVSTLSTTLRYLGWRVKAVVYNDEIIALLPVQSQTLGAAVDLGTTKIALYLMDLETGQTLASKGLMNPQVSYGEDIMTRMTSAQSDLHAAGQFRSLVVDTLNTALLELCTECGLQTAQVINLVVVGNTTMHHLFLGLPVRQLGRAPYVPAVSSALDVKARDLGLLAAPGAYVHLLPNVAGYVGADHVAMLLASSVHHKPGVVLAVDIGTNTEICLANRGVFTCLSTASGPAFEGAHIKDGMRAAAGAIERFQIIDGLNRCQTIENVPPVGICGSGIVDITAQLFRQGIITRRGKMVEHPNIQGVGKEKEYIVSCEDKGCRQVTFTQHDVEQIQLAKGAIRAGIEVLLSRHGLTAGDIDEIIIAGAFGTYLDIGSALTIGLFPAVPESKFRQVGNAAGIGAKLALISRGVKADAVELARHIQYIELAGDPDFLRIFARSMRFG